MPALCNTGCVILELCSAFIQCHQGKEHCWFPVRIAIKAPYQALFCVLSPCCPWGSISTALHPCSSLSPWLPAELSCSAPKHCSTSPALLGSALQTLPVGITRQTGVSVVLTQIETGNSPSSNVSTQVGNTRPLQTPFYAKLTHASPPCLPSSHHSASLVCGRPSSPWHGVVLLVGRTMAWA